MEAEPRGTGSDIAGSREIAAQAVRGSVYNAGTAVVTLTLGFVRAVLLARLLLPDHFGAAALALFFNGLANQLRTLGMDNAVVQRRDVSGDVLPTYFTMRVVFLFGSIAVLAALAPLIGRFYPQTPQLTALILAFAGVSVVRELTATQEALLTRHLAFGRLARVNLTSSVTISVLAPLLAWWGWGVWSLVAEQLSGQLVRAIMIWSRYAPWRPRWGWDPEVARWFWRFGVRMWTGHNLNFILLRFGDFWTGTLLGQTPLGLYSRARQFAAYSERVVAPLRAIFFPTFSRLQGDRLRLSRAFFRAVSVVVRINLALAAILILTAPEAVTLLLGSRWMPLVPAFRLMIVYALFDPIAGAAGDLLLAVGRPGLIVRVRTIQCTLFLPAVMVLGHRFGIEGVALSAGLTMIAGTALLLRETRRIVDYSLRRLWWWPSFAVAGATLATAVLAPLLADLPLWARLGAKVWGMTVVYAALLWLTERAQLQMGWRMVSALLRQRERTAGVDTEGF